MPPEPKLTKVAKVAKAPKIPKEPKPPKAPKASAKAAKVPTLTEVLAKLLAKELLPDLTKRAKQPSLERALQQAWQKEKDAQRTAATFAEWREHTVEQVGAAWILSCVFVRVLEDRGMLARPRIAGEAGGHAALDSQHQFFEIAPSLTERDYLLIVFHELSSFPGAADVLGPAHNPAWRLSPSNDAVRSLLAMLRETDDAGVLRYRFDRASQPTTRFLGDLYQDLSEGVRKRYALLQTPDFVERFILDGTLEPAITEFGLAEVRVIDPTCGSGHFLLGSFERLCDHWQRTAPGMPEREVANRALAQVYGVDLNPYAVAIARFRLTLAYLERAGIDRLSQAPRIETNLVVADSLLHDHQRLLSEQSPSKDWGDALFELTEPERARSLLRQRYHAVVGNPPYIVGDNDAARAEYRKIYVSCYRQFSLGTPFTERFFQLAVDTGYIGLINANSFMKREFGKALIEKVLPTLDVTEVVDTSGAYIPGHGTPTVILFGSNRRPLTESILAVMGKRGEPSTPVEPEHGLVWSSITEHHREIGFENDYVSISAMPRSTLSKHPWSLGGGGAAALKELLEKRCPGTLGSLAASIGFAAISGEDNLFLLQEGAGQRNGLRSEHLRSLVEGEGIRDWAAKTELDLVWPNDDTGNRLEERNIDDVLRFFWPYRGVLRDRKAFGIPVEERGIPWWGVREVYTQRFQTPLSIAYAEVATHNHFVLDRGGKVFKQTAPIIKLPTTATEDDHLALLAYLNSSTACFWLKQVCMNKGGSGIGRGIQDEAWEARYQFDSSKVGKLPVPNDLSKLLPLAREMEACARLLRQHVDAGQTAEVSAVFECMVALQENIDWLVYDLVGLLGDERQTIAGLPCHRLKAGERAFEVQLAQQAIDGEPTAWFERNEYTALTTAPPPETTARMAAIERVPALGMIERAENKRRWGMPEPGAAYEHIAEALRLSNVEKQLEPAEVRSLRSLARDDHAHGEGRELGGMILEQAVPFLAVLRFNVSGIEKHAQWETAWSQQRAEDAGTPTVVPSSLPRYDSTDFSSFTAWQLRGKLDVPKERFISYPGLERDEDPSPLIGWAGWDHLQRAQALAHLFQERQQQDGWNARRLTPILAGMLELLPWLKQWHNEPNAELGGERMGDAYDDFVKEKARELGLTLDDLRAWRPEKSAGRGAAAKAAKAKSAAAAGPDDDELP